MGRLYLARLASRLEEEGRKSPRVRAARRRAEYGAARGGVCTRLAIAAHVHGQEAGPALLWTSFVSQRPYFILEGGKHYEETEVGPDWARSPEGCVELEGGGDGSEFPPEKAEQHRAG